MLRKAGWIVKSCIGPMNIAKNPSPTRCDGATARRVRWERENRRQSLCSRSASQRSRGFFNLALTRHALFRPLEIGDLNGIFTGLEFGPMVASVSQREFRSYVKDQRGIIDV